MYGMDCAKVSSSRREYDRKAQFTYYTSLGNSLGYMAASERLSTSSLDSSVRVWAAQNGQQHCTVPGTACQPVLHQLVPRDFHQLLQFLQGQQRDLCGSEKCRNG